MSFTKFYRCMPLEPFTTAGVRSSKMNDLSSLKNSIKYLKETIPFSETKIVHGKKIFKIYEVLSTLMKTVGTFLILATTSNSVTLSKPGFGLIVTPISTENAGGLSLTSNVSFEKFPLIMIKTEYYLRDGNKKLNLSIEYIGNVCTTM